MNYFYVFAGLATLVIIVDQVMLYRLRGRLNRCERANNKLQAKYDELMSRYRHQAGEKELLLDRNKRLHEQANALSAKLPRTHGGPQIIAMGRKYNT